MDAPIEGSKMNYFLFGQTVTVHEADLFPALLTARRRNVIAIRKQPADLLV